jgi:hypothetical protein
MREIIIRDVNRFWITFGQEISADVLTPWPATDPTLLQRYAGKYESDGSSAVVITVHEGRLLAFPDDGPGVFLRPTGEQTFTPMMSEAATIVFEGGAGPMTALAFEHEGNNVRFVRKENHEATDTVL